jgi:hypothetical protein
MIATLAWKEYREQRALWLAITVLALLVTLNIGLLARAGLAGAHDDIFVRDAIFSLLCALIVAQGVVVGAQAFAGERDAGTLTFLDILSSRRSLLWSTKLTVSAIALLVQALVLFGIVLFLQMGDWAILAWLILAGWQSLLWGMVGGAVSEHMFPAILLGIVLSAGNFALLFMVPIGRSGVQIAMAMAALAISYRKFCAPDTDRRVRAEALQQKRRGRMPNSWLSLIWLAEKQGRRLIWPGLALSFLGGFVFDRDLDYVWPVVTLVMGLLCGLAVFVPEQTGEEDRFLGGQRLPPGRVWLVKTLVWTLVAAGMAGLFYRGIYFHIGLTSNQLNTQLFVRVFFPDGNLRLFLTDWVLLGFGCGQFCGFLSRKLVVSGFLAVGVSLTLLALWVPSLVFGGVMDWQMLTIPVLLVIAARLSMWLWYSGRLYTRRHFVLLAGLGAAIVLWIGANLTYRALEIPDVGEPFDLQAFNTTLEQAARSEANPLMRRGLELLEEQRRTVNEQLGRPTKLLFPLSPSQKELPYYFASGDFLSACLTIVERGWPAQDDELSRWLDTMFAGEWAKNFQAAATKPLGLVVDPRKFHWVTVEKDGKRHWEPFVKVPEYSNVGYLFAARAVQMQARGDDGAALENLGTLLGLSRQLRHCVPNAPVIAQYSGTLHWSALRAFDHWAQKIGPRPKLIREALEVLLRHERELPDRLDGIKADYIITRNHPTGLWGFWSDLSPQAYLLKWGLETPWEGERQSRFINAVYQGAIRAAKLRPGGAAAWDGLYLTDSNWTLEQWRQLRKSVSVYIQWPWFSARNNRPDVGGLHIRQVWLALMLYQIEEGKAAAKLEDLVPRYLASVPVDFAAPARPPNQLFGYWVSQGEEIEGDFPTGQNPRKERLLPGQGVLVDDRWYPVPIWSKK